MFGESRFFFFFFNIVNREYGLFDFKQTYNDCLAFDFDNCNTNQNIGIRLQQPNVRVISPFSIGFSKSFKCK